MYDIELDSVFYLIWDDIILAFSCLNCANSNKPEA